MTESNFLASRIIATMNESGVVPLFNTDDRDLAFQILKTSYQAGVRIFEFTNRSPNSLAVFEHLIQSRQAYPEMILGIGTVMDVQTTEQFIAAGADFIISPILKLDMAAVCRDHHKPWIPGCATLTEIIAAKENGAAIIKVFPGSVLGPGFVSAVMPVVPDLRLMITGGVKLTAENLSQWFDAGAFSVGLGSQLFSDDLIKDKQWTALESRLSDAVTMCKNFKAARSK